MKLTNENIEKIYNDAKRDMTLTVHLLEKTQFELYLDALFLKVVIVKTPEAESQLQTIEWMKKWLARQSYINTLNVVQVGFINELERQIVKLEFEKEKLLEENQKLKENI